LAFVKTSFVFVHVVYFFAELRQNLISQTINSRNFFLRLEVMYICSILRWKLIGILQVAIQYSNFSFSTYVQDHLQISLFRNFFTELYEYLNVLVHLRTILGRMINCVLYTHTISSMFQKYEFHFYYHPFIAKCSYARVSLYKTYRTRSVNLNSTSDCYFILLLPKYHLQFKVPSITRICVYRLWFMMMRL
jgi:hypothetical protein